MTESARRRILITGPAGSGKTHTTAELFLEHAGPSGRGALVLLPDGGAVRSFRDVVASLSGGRGLADQNITSFEEWSRRLLDWPDEQTLSAETREAESLLLLDLAGHLPEPLKGRLGTAGYRHAILSWIAELQESGIGSAEVERLLGSLESSPERLEVLGRLLQMYESELAERGLIARSQLPEFAARLIREGGLPEPAPTILLVDGFHRLSPVRLSLLSVLADSLPITRVTLPAPDGDGWMEDALERTLSSLAEIGDWEEEALSERESVPDRPPRITLFEGGGRQEEMERIGKEIRRLTIEENRPLSDFLVLFRSVDPYREAIGSAFARLDLQADYQIRLPLAATPPGRAFLDCLLVALEGVTRKTVEPCLKNRMFGVAPDLADRVVALWRTRPEPPGGRELTDQIAKEHPGIAAERIEPLLAMESDIAGHVGAAVVRALRDWWYESIEESIVPESYSERDLPTIAAALSRTISFLDRFADFVQSSPTLASRPARSILRLLDQEVRRVLVSAGTNRSGVVVDDYRHGENRRAPVLFLAGLTAGDLPRPYHSGAFWNEADRALLNSTGQYRVPDRTVHRAEERFLFRRAFSRGSDLVYLSQPSSSPGRADCGESPFSTELRDEPGFEAIDRSGPDRFRTVRSVVTGDDLAPFLVSRLDRMEGDREGAALAARLIERTGRRGPVPPADFFRAVSLRSDSGFVRWVAAKKEFSVSELEDFQDCPFRYLARHVYKLDEEDAANDFTPTASAEGGALHRSLEESLRDGADLDNSLIEQFENLRGPFPEQVGHDMRRTFWIENLPGLIQEDESFREKWGWHPDEFEVRFGVKTGNAIALDKKTAVSGRIDRIDKSDDNTFLVIDYKRGDPAGSKYHADMEAGRSLALPLYLEAAAKWRKEKPAGAFLLSAKGGTRTGFVRKNQVEKKNFPPKSTASYKVLEEAEFEKRLKEGRANALKTVKSIRAGVFAVDPVTDETCRNLRCAFHDLCRVVLAAREKKP